MNSNGKSCRPLLRQCHLVKTQVSHPCFILSVALQFTEGDDFDIKAISNRQLAFSFKLSTFGTFT